MITEPAVPGSTVVPTEISETIGNLHGEINKLKLELGQAMDVWQSTLASEKGQLGELLKHKELAWTEQENQWAKQSQAYEQRLGDLKADFEARLKQTEQNAAQALAQLDDDWQRDKLEWGSQEQWAIERQALKEKVASLESALAEKKASASPTPDTVKVLQGQLLEFQQTVASFQDRAARSDELVNACVQALDYQISVLYDLVQHFVVQVPAGEPPPKHCLARVPICRRLGSAGPTVGRLPGVTSSWCSEKLRQKTEFSQGSTRRSENTAGMILSN